MLLVVAKSKFSLSALSYIIQLYVSQLHLESERLSAALEDTNTEIIVIGCGDWQPIEKYAGAILL